MSRANSRVGVTAEKFFFEESMSTAEKLTLRNLIDASLKTEVKSASFTAADGGDYVVTATSTVTDPTPTEGARFTVFVRNGTVTVGGVATSVVGATVVRSYHSGSWSNKTYIPTDSLLSFLGINSYADRTVANADLDPGNVFYDLSLATLNTATD
jgi:hypothetical protein